MENGFIESFNGKLRDECLNEEWFVDLDDARTKIEAWRVNYNDGDPTVRSSSGDPRSLRGVSRPLALNPGLSQSLDRKRGAGQTQPDGVSRGASVAPSTHLSIVKARRAPSGDR